MAQLVRTLDEIGNWERNSYPSFSWLDEDDFQSNVMRDLRPSNNSLSVFQVNEEVDVERIVVAVAAGKMNIDKCDYVILDQEALDGHGFKLSPKKGTTRDAAVNEAHFDLVEMGVKQLIKLAEIISGAIDSGQHGRLFPQLIEQRINEALCTGRLKSLAPRLQGELLKKQGADACNACKHSGRCVECGGIGFINLSTAR